MTGTSMIQTDAVVIGAGPVGLFQVFQLGLLDIKAHVVDTLPHPGGQCIELYADKPIYDIPGTPRTSGRELVASLLKQIKPFGASFHLGQEVTSVAPQADGRFLVETSHGTMFLAKTLFIAAGVGSFQPKRLKIAGLDAFENSQLFHHASESALFAGKNVLVVGGDETAIDQTARLAQAGPQQAKSVTLLHRRDVLQAPPEVLVRFDALRINGGARFQVGQVTGIDSEDGKLKAVRITDVDGNTSALQVDMMLVLLGLSPKLGPLMQWGLDMERKQLLVDTEKFSTSIPGIFAVGDINTYPGKKKLILCGFHECALAAFGAAALIFPDQKIQLQYTTTSPKLHKLLGVEPPLVD
ncbi:NAD(P)/FAD-dependent oxidoreductase [Polaromonas eurypsychrophila]|uniref:Ferredoxin--NADP reductase n=1 Tax=Polaromonas eurypsychrophila TaxID=1614635 RepID=A0A916SGW7_9BURK|nr:NAD(P)/FAD-dependent oxidoreductase [Polaromonas eurypsychrophila]GGA99625.1 ferredoxin--NADP reductase [Polaromonas eurypsychrophila]